MHAAKHRFNVAAAAYVADDTAQGIDDPRANILMDLDDLYAPPESEEGIRPEPAPAKAADAGEADASDVGESGGPAPLKYDGGARLPAGVPTREDLVKGASPKLHAKVNELTAKAAPVFFMPTDVEEINEYVKGVPTHRLVLFGALIDGSKAQVILEDVPVFFDVRVTVTPVASSNSMSDFDTYLRQLLVEAKLPPARIGKVTGFPSKEFCAAKVPYRRVYYANLQDRKKAILAAREYKLQTANDDRSSHYRKVAREHGIVLTDWLILKDYAHTAGRTPKNPLCAHAFRLPVGSCRSLVDPMAPAASRARASLLKRQTPGLAKDRTLVCSWDIETHTARTAGDLLPRAGNPEDHMFALVATFHWKDDADPLLAVSLVDKPAAPDPRWVTIVCDDERGIYRGFALLWHALAPDIEKEFNGSEYDWPFIVERARQTGDLGWMCGRMTALPRGRGDPADDAVYDWNYRRDQRIKITAEETTLANYFRVPGCVSIDVRTVFRKLYPKSEVSKGSSLKFYLKMCDLPSKADMPIIPMWRGYEAGDPEFIRKILHYCMVDCLSTMRLALARNVIPDRREVGAMSYVNLADCHYYADGMKVMNMLIAYAVRRDIMCSNIPNEEIEEGKYPGAKVYHPAKGLENERPVTGLDINSLYPSIIMAFNLSPEKILLTDAQADAARKTGLDLHLIEFTFNGRKIRGWAVRHGDDKAKIGLFPSILIDLFDKRLEVKNILAPLKREIELIELVQATAKKGGMPVAAAIAHVAAEARAEAAAAAAEAADPQADPTDRAMAAKRAKALRQRGEELATLPTGEEALSRRLQDTSFVAVGIDAKQKAIKVFMNTFYGESGNSRSAAFLLQLAGGVTSAGQWIITSAVDFAVSRGYKLKYGDTDSMYLVAPDAVYADVDAALRGGTLTREQHWTAMVKITMRVMAAFVEEVNAHMKKLTGTGYIRFAFEDVLFPVVMTGKKKYYGIAHVDAVNFRPKKLFIRGIDVVKQGQTELAKTIGKRIMDTSMRIDNDRSLLEIVEAVIVEAVQNSAQWEFKHFVQTSAYKPGKKNVTVLRFVERMRIRHARELELAKTATASTAPSDLLYKLPEPGERFEFVMCEIGAEFDLRGYRAKPKVGDVMEFAHVARALGLPIDVPRYISSYVIGLCARFINYAAQFQPPTDSASMTDKAVDAYSQARAKKYLDSLTLACDKKTMAARGVAFKRAYRRAAACAYDAVAPEARKVLAAYDGLSYELFVAGESDASSPNTPTAVVARMAELAKERAAELVKADGPRYCEGLAARRGISKAVPFGAAAPRRTYRTGPRTATPAVLLNSALDRCEARLRTAIAGRLGAMTAVATKYEVSLSQLVEHFRGREAAANPALALTIVGSCSTDTFDEETPPSMAGLFEFDGAERAALAEMRRLFGLLVGLQLVRQRRVEMDLYVQRLRDKHLGVVRPPADPKAMRRDAAATAKKLVAPPGVNIM